MRVSNFSPEMREHWARGPVGYQPTSWSLRETDKQDSWTRSVSVDTSMRDIMPELRDMVPYFLVGWQATHLSPRARFTVQIDVVNQTSFALYLTIN